MPHILFAASGSDSVWHPTACQGGLIPYWYLALTGFPFARLSFSAWILTQHKTVDCVMRIFLCSIMQLNASDSAYWLCPVLVAGSAESEGGMRAAVSMEDIDKSFMGLRCVSR